MAPGGANNLQIVTLLLTLHLLSILFICVCFCGCVAYLGLRSDHCCAAWEMKAANHPRSLEVVQLKQRATSLNVRCAIAYLPNVF